MLRLVFYCIRKMIIDNVKHRGTLAVVVVWWCGVDNII